MRRLVPLALAACLATALAWTGTQDLECYETAFCSLARGTRASTVTAFGQPVYTLSIGLGTRLPLHGNLDASPAAMAAPVLPEPLTYWLLLTLSMAAAALLVVSALQPLGGPILAWCAVLTLFWSPPMLAYTVFNDWPETAVTYCALVAGVFAPHALVGVAGLAGTRAGRWMRPALVALTFSLLAAAHPGYWAQLVAAVALSSLLLFARPVDRPGDRWTAILLVAGAGALALAMHVPDLARELRLGVGLSRDMQGPAGSLAYSNAFPWSSAEPRVPFTLIALALAAALAVPIAGRRWVPFVWAVVACSLGFGAAAALMLPSAFTIGSLVVSQSTTWTLRDPAIVFAVMGGACACGALVRDGRPSVVRWAGVSVLALCAAQGLGYASALLRRAPPLSSVPWNHDWSDQRTRATRRGQPAGQDEPGMRIALWPGVRLDMRLSAHASTVWPDAGYPLVTAWTKNRTMAGVVRPNEILFDQTTDLSAQVLCDGIAAPFLRLRYLVMPDEQSCAGWSAVPGARIDGRWSLARLSTRDTRVFAVHLAGVSPGERSAPAFGGDLHFVSRLAPVDGSTLALESNRLSVTTHDRPRDSDLALVLPVAYDPAWQTSQGRTLNLGGLLAVEGASASGVELTYVPDAALRVRALGMLAAQVAGALGIGLVSAFPGTDNRAVAARPGSG